jgi:hypothetical protein
MTGNQNGENRPGNDLSGFEGAYGKKADKESPRMEAKPRLIPVDRKQMRIVPVDVERLIPEDHEARAIWDFVGSLDFAPYYRDIGSVEGEAGCPAYDPHVLMSIWVYAYAKGIGSGQGDSKAHRVRSGLPAAHGYGDNKLSHPLRLQGRS